MSIVTFNPNRQMLQVADRVFLLDLNLRQDGTGIARLSEMEPNGRVTLITAGLRYHPHQDWTIGTGRGATPKAAALDLLTPSFMKSPPAESGKPDRCAMERCTSHAL